MSTRPETAEHRLNAAQKEAAEARAVADAAERVLAEERQRLAQAGSVRMQAWARSVHDAYATESAAAAQAVASTRSALGRAILEDFPAVGAAYLAWRHACSDGNALVARYARARHELGQPQPTERLPFKHLNSLLEVVDMELAAACRLHDLECEDSLVAELDAVGQGRWQEPFHGHSAGCPNEGGVLEVMTASKPSPVIEVTRGSRVQVMRGPASVVQVRRCQACGGQEQVGQVG